MLEVVLTVLALTVLLIASYTDLKKREVPDWLSYGFIFSVLGIRAIFSLENFDLMILLKGVLGLIVFLILGFIFYYSRFWGGGDTKILVGLGAALGFEFNLSNDLIYFFVLLLFAGGMFGLAYVLFLAIKNKNSFFSQWKNLRKKYAKQERIFLFVFLILFLISLVLAFVYSFIILLFPLVLLAFFYLLFFFKAVELSSFYRYLPIENLTEGDWLAEEINLPHTKIKPKPLTKKEINKLAELKKQNKLSEILIKEGVPFIPSFLLAFLINLLAKDWLMGLLK